MVNIHTRIHTHIWKYTYTEMPTEWIKQAFRGLTLGYEDPIISHYMYRIFFGQDNYLRMMWNYIDHILVTQMYVIYTVLLKTLYTRADLVKYLAAESVFGRVNDYITCPSFLLHHYFLIVMALVYSQNVQWIAQNDPRLCRQVPLRINLRSVF